MKTTHPWRHRPGFNLGASASSKSQNRAASRGIAYHRRVYKQLQKRLLDEAELMIEPWFQRIDGSIKPAMRSPDAVIRYPYDNTAIVVEVKMNWAEGRDEKLLYEYLPIVRSAFGLDCVWPLMITSCLRGYAHPPLLGLQQIDRCLEWEPGRPTPLLLLP